MKLTLDQLPIGKGARIAEVLGSGDSITRLMEMGLVAGSMVKVERMSPFGCPIAIRLKGTSIAIRRHDAQKVILELQPA
jgi:Fe2+ transport system protein FeoA